MHYAYVAISDNSIPCASNPLLQHLLDSYVSESNKIVSAWREFADEDLTFKPHPKSTDVAGILKHQLLSERRFFGEFLGTPEPPAEDVLPLELTIRSAQDRHIQLVRRRLPFLAAQSDAWWLEIAPFFEVHRERIWIFWRRVLHSAHHRAQLTVYLRLLNKPVPVIYGPTADVKWDDADPTDNVAAAGRK